MKPYHEQSVSRGFLMVIIPFIMILSIYSMLLMSEFYKAYTTQANINKDLKRISTKITIQEVRDLYSIDRDAIVKEPELEKKIKDKIQEEMFQKYKSNVDSLITTVRVKEKEIEVENSGYLKVKPISKLIKKNKSKSFEVKVKGRCKVQRMDSGRVE